MITASRPSDTGVASLEQWVTQFDRDGFLALRGYFSADEIDRAIVATNEAL